MGKTMDFAINLSMLMSGNFTGTVSPAIQRVSELDQKLQGLSKTAAGAQKLQAMKTSLEGLREKLNAAQMRVKTLRTEMSQTEHPSKRMRQEFTKANIDAAKLKEAVQKQMKSIADLGKSLREAGVDTSKLGSEQDRLRSSIDRVKAAQDKLNSARSRYAQLRERLDWGNIKNDVMTILGTYSALKAPIKLSADFESAMARVKAVAFSGEGADLSGFEAMKNQALQLGADTQFTAIQAAATQENLARAGMSAKNIMSAMPAVLDMAAAEGMDLAQAGSIIAKGLGGMNLSGEYAVRLADILAYTSANSNTNIAMLGEAFKVAAPVFASQGVRMEQLAAYLGVLANKGYEGSEAGNAIAAAPLRLAKQNKETQVMLRELGVAVQTRDGRLRELPDVMIALDQAMKARNYGEVKQLEVIETIFGKNYGKAMMAFMQASAAGDAERMQNGVQNNSFGQAKKMADINLDTLNGQLQILGSAWDGLRTTIGDTFSPVVRQGAELLAVVLSDLNKLMKEFPLASSGVVWAFTGLASYKAVSRILDIGKALIQLPGAWLEVRRAAATAQTAVEGTAAATKIFGMNLNTALGMLGLIAFACYEIYQHWEDITAAAQRAGEAISNIDRSVPVSQLKAGDTAGQRAGNAEYHIRQMESMYSVPEIKPHAFGGIMTRPHIGMVAEAGPEAIIPLTDKSRGVPLVMRAAQILGLSQNFQTSRNFTQNSQKFSNINRSVSSLSGYSGVINRTQNDTIISQERQMINYVSQTSNDTHNGNPAVRDSSLTFNPTYNITVNGEGSSGIGENIRAVIEDTMNEIMSRMERVSYA